MNTPDQIDITSLNLSDRNKLYQFYLSLSKNKSSENSIDKKSEAGDILPEELYKPLKIRDYEEFRRKKIYGD